ncbi:MAG: hypothetical protein PHN71_04620 [Candidatus Cloacimonetes bacterium]|nr:hypothetical protein [Candidatus Cloacimonadota bacterium]MDD4687157.1 hypothetical protein [Candidatus Cloacimonadota bacterium]
MNYVKHIIIMLLALILIGACTKKDNLTGTNWSGLEPISFESEEALVSGYTFPADSLSSIFSNRKALLVGKWNSCEARSILRFTDLPADSVIANYHDIQNPKLSIVLTNSSNIENNPVKLIFYKVNSNYLDDPFAYNDEDLAEISQIAYTLQETIADLDTLSLDLPFEFIRNWQADADSTGLNILIKASDEAGFADGFVEMQLSSPSLGSKISYEYKLTSSDEEYSSFSKNASRNAFNLIYEEAPVTEGLWKVSNYNPQRMYLDLNVDMNLFKDENGVIIPENELKRVSINKAELVLYTNTQTPSLKNTLGYDFTALLLKDAPQENEIVPTTWMYLPEFSSNIVNYAAASADSVKLDITPIIQAYVSGGKFPDGSPILQNGIVVMSNYERKDFGEIEFFNALTAPEGKKPYIRIKYTPPFL